MTGKQMDLDEVTIDGLQRGIQSGLYTARSICEGYFARIKALDKQGPAINAIIEMNPDALAIADELDREYKQRGLRGPLHGIPMLLKDNIDTGDRMMTTAGSLALKGAPAEQDAFLVEQLRTAGAVILGKANLSEWANFRASHSVSGWSGRGGQTRNPYVLDRNPCGSSSGSAVAVASNLCAVSVGTETDGSIVCPSAVNGIVGIKPTLGLISRNGIVPIAHSQDTPGPMARTVRDAAILLNALAGTDPADSATERRMANAAADYTEFLNPRGLNGARLGIARQFFGFNDAVDKIMEDSIFEMKRQGAGVVDPIDFPSHEKLHECELEVLLYEFKSDLNVYLKKRGTSVRVRSLSDIITFNEENRIEEMPFFGQDLFVKADKKGQLTEKTYVDALKRNHLLCRTEGIDAMVAKHRLDAIVAPTTGPAWLTDWITGDHESGSCSTPAAVAGYPHITVPAGSIHGLPVGISFFGPAWSEPTLLRLAYSFEQATRIRKPPNFLETIDFKNTLQ